MQEPVLSVDDVLKLVKDMMSYPFPQICRHDVALRLMDALQRKGWKAPDDLCRAVVKCQDDEALRLLERHAE